MWQIERRKISPATEAWHLSAEDGARLPFAQVFSLWRDSPAFRTFWTACFRDIPFAAYCWECPALTSARLASAFECVIVESPLLARNAADSEPFEAYFRSDREVVSFENLGGDALLIAPCPAGKGGDFSHLARFLATAKASLVSALWAELARTLAARIGERPLWLSTAGLGVPWLHLRLDSSPKYYRHAPYRNT